MLKELSIEITRKCPNCCLHCSSSSNKYCNEKMPYNKFKEIVLDAKELGANTVCLSGGEPFLHNEIVKMIDFVHSCQLNCYVYTSGIVFDEFGTTTSLPKELIKEISSKVTKLIFNIEAGTEDTYDKIMCTKNCFEKMKQSVFDVVQAGICAEAHFVPMAVNIEEIDAVISLCEKMNISKLSFLRLVLHGRAVQNKDVISLTTEQYVKLKTHLLKIQNQSSVPIRIGVPLTLESSCHKCEAANGKLNIKYDGEVFPCEVFKNYSMNSSFKGIKPDNIYETSLLNIYNNSKYLQFVRNVEKQFLDMKSCENCVGQYLMKLEKKRGNNND